MIDPDKQREKEREERRDWPAGGKPVEPGTKSHEEWLKALRKVGN